MTRRAAPSGRSLTKRDAAVVKAMLGRGDRQHDVAAWFGVNAGRIADIAAGRSFAEVEPVHGQLPPPGPYTHVREVYAALEVAEAALAAAKKLVASYPC